MYSVYHSQLVYPKACYIIGACMDRRLLPFFVVVAPTCMLTIAMQMKDFQELR